jgi:hypothetical protein
MRFFFWKEGRGRGRERNYFLFYFLIFILFIYYLFIIIYLTRQMYLLSSHSAENKLTRPILASVFGPILLPPRVNEDSSLVAKVIRLLITVSLFPPSSISLFYLPLLPFISLCGILYDSLRCTEKVPTPLRARLPPLTTLPTPPLHPLLLLLLPRHQRPVYKLPPL